MRVAMLAGISWLQTLTAPLLTVLGAELSVRDLILICGGLFVLFKATTARYPMKTAARAPRRHSGKSSRKSSFSTSYSPSTPSSQPWAWLTTSRSWSSLF